MTAKIKMFWRSLAKTSIIAVGVLGFVIHSSFAQELDRESERRAATARARKESAEMNLASVEQGLSQRTAAIREQNQKLQAKRAQLAGLQKKEFGDYWKGRIAVLQQDIRDLEAQSQQTQSTLIEFRENRRKYEQQVRNADAEILRIAAKTNRENPMNTKDAGEEVQRRLIRTEQVGTPGSGHGYYTVRIYKVTYANGSTAEVRE